MDDQGFAFPEVSTTRWRKGTWLTAHRKRDLAHTPTPKEQQRTEEGEKGWTHFAAGKTAHANRAKGKLSGWPETPPRNSSTSKVLERESRPPEARDRRSAHKVRWTKEHDAGCAHAVTHNNRSHRPREL
jgi:hypothetical protein